MEPTSQGPATLTCLLPAWAYLGLPDHTINGPNMINDSALEAQHINLFHTNYETIRVHMVILLLVSLKKKRQMIYYKSLCKVSLEHYLMPRKPKIHCTIKIF